MTEILLSLAGLLRLGAPTAEGEGHAEDEVAAGFTAELAAEPTGPVAPQLPEPASDGARDPLRNWLEEKAGISAELAQSAARAEGEGSLTPAPAQVEAPGTGAHVTQLPPMPPQTAESGPWQARATSAAPAQAEGSTQPAPAIGTERQPVAFDLPPPAPDEARTALPSGVSPADATPPDLRDAAPASDGRAIAPAEPAPLQEQPMTGSHARTSPDIQPFPGDVIAPPRPGNTTSTPMPPVVVAPVRETPAPDATAPASAEVAQAQSQAQIDPALPPAATLVQDIDPARAAPVAVTTTDPSQQSEAPPLTDARPGTQAPVPAQPTTALPAQIPAQATTQPGGVPPDQPQRHLVQAVSPDGLATMAGDERRRTPAFVAATGSVHGPAMAEPPVTTAYGLQIRDRVPVQPEFLRPEFDVRMMAPDNSAAFDARISEIAEVFMSATGGTNPTGREGAQAAPGRPEGAAPVLRQIGEALVSTRSGVTELILAPEELGRLHMTVIGHERPQLLVWAERPETMELLRRNIEQLSAELQEAGVDAGMLDFRDGPPPRMPQQAGDDDQGNGAGLRQTALAVPAALAIEQTRPLGARRIDVRL